MDIMHKEFDQYPDELYLLGNDNGARIMLGKLLSDKAIMKDTANELFTLLKKARERDRATYQHNLRVSAYALKIAQKLNLPLDTTVNVVFAALFHDIGKINIQEEVLKKETCITYEEYELIKKHSKYGVQLVKNTYCENVSDIIMQHHERLDGSGYPNGLKGDEILLEARIIAVSDAYDAMVTNRAYKDARSPREATDELARSRGKQYDATIVDCLFGILREEGVI